MALHSKEAVSIPENVLFEGAPHHQGLYGSKQPVRVTPLDSQERYGPGDLIRMRIIASGRSFDPKSILFHCVKRVTGFTTSIPSDTEAKQISQYLPGQDYMDEHLSACFESVRVKLNGSIDVDYIRPYNRLRAAIAEVEIASEYKSSWGASEGYESKNIPAYGAGSGIGFESQGYLGQKQILSKNWFGISGTGVVPPAGPAFPIGGGKLVGTGLPKNGSYAQSAFYARMRSLVKGEQESVPLDLPGFCTINKMLPLGALGSVDIEIQLAPAVDVMKSCYDLPHASLLLAGTNITVNTCSGPGSMCGVPCSLYSSFGGPVLATIDEGATVDITSDASGAITNIILSGLPPAFNLAEGGPGGELWVEVPVPADQSRWGGAGYGVQLTAGTTTTVTTAAQSGLTGSTWLYQRGISSTGKVPSTNLSYFLEKPHLTFDVVTFNDKYNSAINTRLDRGLNIEYDTYSMYQKTFAANQGGMKELKIVRTLQSLKSVIWWFQPNNTDGKQGITATKHTNLTSTFPLLGVQDYQLMVNNRPVLSHSTILKAADGSSGDQKSEAYKQLQKAFKHDTDIMQDHNSISTDDLANPCSTSTDLNYFGQKNIFSYDFEKSDMRSGQYMNEITVQMSPSSGAAALGGVLHVALHYDARVVVQSGRAFTQIQ